MVEIHGGGFVIGSPPNQAHLAAAGHVITVAIHYRLGILGFLAEKAPGQHSGDYGLMDHQPLCGGSSETSRGSDGIPTT